MKYKGFTIIKRMEGFQILSNSLTIGWMQDFESAKRYIDNMFVATFA